MSPRMGEDVALALELEGRGATHGEVKALVAVADQLAALPEPEIDPAFAAALEAQLLTDGLEVAPTGRPQLTIVKPAAPAQAEPVRRAPVVQMPSRRYTIRRSLVAAATAASLSAFPVVAAAQSLPGSPFYGLKETGRKMQLAMFGGKVADGFTLMRHADAHVDEAGKLAAFPTPRQDLIAATLEKAAGEMARAKSYILGATADPATLARLADMARDTAGDAEGITGLDRNAREAADELIKVSEGIEQAVRRVLGFGPALSVKMPAVGSPASTLGNGSSTGTGSTGSSSGGNARGNKPGKPNDGDTVRKPIDDAADTGCRTIGEAQFGNSLAGASQTICETMEGAARV